MRLAVVSGWRFDGIVDGAAELAQAGRQQSSHSVVRMRMGGRAVVRR
jgi:hypothetical protein